MEIPVIPRFLGRSKEVKTLTESLIFALMILLPLLVAERIDARLGGPESAQACSCDPHLEMYFQYAAQSLHPGRRAGDHLVVVVDDDFREDEGDLTRSATK
jgi:hypothetical protein